MLNVHSADKAPVKGYSDPFTGSDGRPVWLNRPALLPLLPFTAMLLIILVSSERRLL